MKRRSFLGALGAAGALAARPGGFARAAPAAAMQLRAIPASGERLPVIGMGTSGTFEVGESPADRAPLIEVTRLLLATPNSLIDTAPSYGRAEATGAGVVHCITEWAKDKNFNLDGCHVIIQGFGNVGSYTARLLSQKGAVVIGVGDVGGYLANPEGINPHKLGELKKRARRAGVTTVETLHLADGAWPDALERRRDKVTRVLVDAPCSCLLYTSPSPRD